MKCKNYKMLLMDLIYDEISDSDRTDLLTHLDTCKDCLKEYNAMKTVPDFLDNWQDEKSEVNLVFADDSVNIFQKIKEFVLNFQLVKRSGFAFAMLFLILALFNTKIEIKDGSFSFETGLIARNEKTKPFEIAPEIVEQLKVENAKMTADMLAQYKTENDQHTMLLLSSVATQLRTERSNEFQTLLSTVNQAYDQNDYRIRQTNYTLDELVKLINYSE